MWNDKQGLITYIQTLREKGKTIDLSHQVIGNMDLGHENLSYINWEWTDFQGVVLEGADFTGSNLKNTKFSAHTNLRGAKFTNADLQGAAFRYCDLTGAHMEGANVRRANFEFAGMDGITSNEETKFFRLYCPETGPILGYKKCCNDRIVQLLIPADAKRTSATGPSCRCNKAKVLTIKSFDCTESFDEAWSLVDPDFVYRVGQWVEVRNFNEDRWMDSTTGIHFWLTRQEAMDY